MVSRERVWELLENYLAEVDKTETYWGYKVTDFASGREILALEPQAQVMAMREAVSVVASLPVPEQYVATTLISDPPHDWSYSLRAYNRRRSRAASALISHLARRALPYQPDDIHDLIHNASQVKRHHELPYAGLLGVWRRYLSDPPLLEACRDDLEQVGEVMKHQWPSAEQRKLSQLLDEMLTGSQGLPIQADEWGDQVRPLLDGMEAEERERWLLTLRECAGASGSAPSAKWQAKAKVAREPLGMKAFAQLATEWIGAFRKTANKPPAYDEHSHQFLNNGSVLDERNADLLRGLIWLCADVEDERLAATLGDAAIAGYRKITGHGPRSAKVAGACVYALKHAPRLSGAASLERARLNVKQPQYMKGIERALDEMAAQSGISREGLEELTTPTFDLEDGRLRETFGAFTAELVVDGVDVRLRWLDVNGKPRKSEPAEVKRDFKDEVRALKRLRDDLARMLAAQRDRLERLPLAERSWTLPEWRRRYVDHPLIAGLSRRLVWRFTVDGRVIDGAWLDGALVNAEDKPLALPDTALVSTWHPVFARPEETLAWRTWLLRHQVTQPFKQAHREVYLLTDAERATRVYSNRFAGHILKQHQFNALCAARGWRNSLRLMVDDSYPPATIELPRWNLRAEYWIEGAGDTYEVDTNATGTYLRVATDQVRFYPIDAGGNIAHAGGGGYHPPRWGGLRHEPVPLEEIPPLVFSEVMRDVDLFVGVASVGADPTWQDGGPDGRYVDYWRSYSFGELSATAETRKQTLEWLLPRLTIVDRCLIDGRFLRVRGDLRSYKIHLGSGNILMEPNDQYLCIVPSRGGGDAAQEGLYLPFEGDAVLSIILSKAFLLAEDTKITDQTITRQIGR